MIILEMHQRPKLLCTPGGAYWLRMEQRSAEVPLSTQNPLGLSTAFKVWPFYNGAFSLPLVGGD